MKHIKLQETRFEAIPLKNVVGIGNSTAYQISVSTGNLLGTMGPLEELRLKSAGNEPNFENYRKEDAGCRRSWLRSVLSR